MSSGVTGDERQNKDGDIYAQSLKKYRQMKLNSEKKDNTIKETFYEISDTFESFKKIPLLTMSGIIRNRQAKSFAIHEQLNYKNILKCKQLYFSQKQAKYTHEPYLNTLKNHKSVNLTYELKLMIIESIANSLYKLHQLGIIHNYVKPESICICELQKRSIVAKLNNFFFCESQKNQFLLEPFLREKCSVNNPYASPQARRQNTQITAATDIWSLGAIFYQLIFGTLKGIKVSQNAVQIYFPEKTPQWLIRVLDGMLAFDPSLRYDANYTVSILRPANKCIEATEKMLSEIDVQSIYQGKKKKFSFNLD